MTKTHLRGRPARFPLLLRRAPCLVRVEGVAATCGAALLLFVGLVVGLGGAILGSALVYIFPALMAIGEKNGAMSKKEKVLNWGLAGAPYVACDIGGFTCDDIDECLTNNGGCDANAQCTNQVGTDPLCR